MMNSVLNKIVGSFTLLLLSVLAPTHADAANPDLLKGKKEAEAKGYIFFSSHDEIVAMAKKERKLRGHTNLAPRTITQLINAFKQKYPFITDIHIEEISGADAFQRFILEMQAGQAKGWDIANIRIESATEYMPYLMKHDIFSMAKQGVLKIDPRMIHPVERNIVGVLTVIRALAYNSKLISEDKAPDKWEDFLRPEFKGNKFIMELRPVPLAGLVPAWGLERTLDFARKLAAQQPVWRSGAPGILATLTAGEHPFFLGANFASTSRAIERDPTGSLGYKIIEPVPTETVPHSMGILNTAGHPHAALLWLEFVASPEAQEILDKFHPLAASVFTPGSALAQVTRGKKLSVVDWNNWTEFQKNVEKIFAAYGFPKAGK